MTTASSPSRPLPRRGAGVQPRPHQVSAIDDALTVLSSSARAQVHMACGTGKTLVGIRVLEHFLTPGGVALVMVPSLALVDQWVRSLRSAGVDGVEILAVCSDSDVGTVDDDVAVSRADLAVPSTTDPSQLAEHLRQCTDKGRSAVVLATYTSSHVLAKAAADHGVGPWAIVICDEAHRVAGISKDDLVRRWSTILMDDLIPARKRLFLTATPRVHAARAGDAGDGEEVETVASMDDENLFGPVAHTLPFREAVQRGLLSDFRIVIMVVDDEDIGHALAGAARGSAHRLATQVVVAKTVARYGLNSVLVFHNRVHRSRLFAESLPTVASTFASGHPDSKPLLTSQHVDGGTPRARRESAFRALREAHFLGRGWSALSNCRCVAEGVDLPALDAVVIADPRRSAVDVTQVVGRAMRKSPHRDGPSYVVLPVYLPPGGQDEEAAILSSDFRHAYQVLTALSDHDELLAEELRATRQVMAQDPAAAPELQRVEVVLSERYTDRAVQAVRAHVVRRTTSPFWGWYALLQRFVEQHGHAKVEKDYRTEHGDALGTWVRTQRRLKAAGTLSLERGEALERLPGWVWAVQEDTWTRRYAELMDFVEEHGHARPPATHPLSSWVAAQRQGPRAGWLSEERRELLDQLQGWAWNATEAAWEEGYEELVRYVEEHGTAAVPKGYTPASGYKLANWVINQRRRLRDGRMRPGEPARLEALPGWSWDPATDRWNTMLGRVRQAWGQDGRTIPHDSDLGTWMAKQRVDHRRGNLSPERQRLLSALPGWRWDPKDEAWEQGLAATAQFLRAHGHTRIGGDVRTAGGVELRQWVSRQRRDYRNGTLPAEQIRRLEELAGWTWEPWQEAWMDKYRILAQHVADHGTARMANEYRTPDGYGLGEWVRSQRRRIEAGLATDEQRRLLEALPGFVR